MLKWAGLAIAGVSAASAAVLLKVNLGGNDQAYSEADANLPFATADEFKTKAKEIKCVNNHFPNLDLTTPSPAPSSFPSDLSFSGGTGCLIVNWSKTTHTDKSNKWSGTFKWLWLYGSDARGFAVLGIAQAPDSGSSAQLSSSGKGYILKKNDGGDGWKVEYEKEFSNKTFTKDDFESKFPKLPDTFAGKSHKDKNHFGFAAKSDIENICTSADKCNEGTQKTDSGEKHLWTWSPSSDSTAVTLDSWNSNFSEWSKDRLDSSFGLQDKIKTLKGTWTQIV